MRPLEVIVVGGGIAGMAYAVELIERAEGRPLRIRVLSKAAVSGSSSYAAQGGVAAAMGPGDSFAKHIEDTLRVGDGRNDRAVVEQVVEGAPGVIRWLQGMGARFDEEAPGRLHLAREGGHGMARVVHHRDRTGEEIVRTLRARLHGAPQVELLEGHRALDLIIEGGPGGQRCTGIRAIELQSGELVEHRADAVVLATGGAGQVYAHTTNPQEATGDGIAMAARAAIALRDMAFVQFHPTALHTGRPGQVPLISEAVRGAGARLLRHDGTPLMAGIHPAGDLAPRNIVARAIHAEMLRSGMPYALLDASPIGQEAFAREFPAIDRDCRAMGIIPGRDLLPVMPAAHYLCGGIATDGQGRTAMPGLLALGECACTGLHGADRLASNSLLEALVVPRHAAAASWNQERHGALPKPVHAGRSPLAGQGPSPATEARAALQQAMSAQVGLVRDAEGMRQAMGTIEQCERLVGRLWREERWSPALIDLRDLTAVARAIALSALSEPRSVGTHFLAEHAPAPHEPRP